LTGVVNFNIENPPYPPLQKGGEKRNPLQKGGEKRNPLQNWGEKRNPLQNWGEKIRTILNAYLLLSDKIFI
jgi:hypothetical protein